MAFGERDGVFHARNIQLDQKRYTEDFVMKYVSSATAWKASVTGWTSTAAKTISSSMGAPRNVKFVNNMVTTAERAIKVAVKGYDAQGEYREETLTLSRATAGVTSGSVPFAYVTSIVPATATKGYGTYGTVSLYRGDKVGLTEYCESQADVLQVEFIRGTALAFAARTATSYPINSTTFSPTYQSVNLSALAPAGSSINIRYLSKFQRRQKN